MSETRPNRNTARRRADALAEHFGPFARLSRRLLVDLLDSGLLLDDQVPLDFEPPLLEALFPPVTVAGKKKRVVGFGYVGHDPPPHLDTELFLGKDIGPLLLNFFAARPTQRRGGRRRRGGPAGFSASAAGELVSVPASAVESAAVPIEGGGVAFPGLFLMGAERVPPEVAWSIRLHMLAPGYKPKVEEGRRHELVLVHARADAGVPVAALAHLVGGAVAQDLDEDVYVHQLGSTTTWRYAAPDENASRSWKSASLSGTFPEAFLKKSRPGHVYVYSEDPAAIPPGVFDRVISVGRGIPDRLPAEAKVWIHPSYFPKEGEDPYFCSFVATNLLRPAAAAADGDDGFQARDLPMHLDDRAPPGRVLSRLERDACAVVLDPIAVASSWQEWQDQPKAAKGSFLDFALETEAVSPRSMGRWARAVTNRRVGVALSGGGACAFRAVPLLKTLDDGAAKARDDGERDVPDVDVIVGLSGGALVGGFFCQAGAEGLQQVVSWAPAIQVTMPIGLVTTVALEWTIDCLLSSARVENQEVRFGAVAVAMVPKRSPVGRVVTRGTIGEAIRVSGALPPSFGRVRKSGAIYTDGGGGTLVPADVARDYGADLIFACNAIPGPARSDPRSGTIFDLVKIPSPLDRLIDSFAWSCFMWRHASERFARPAGVFLEFEPQTISILEAGRWFFARDIVEEAKKPENQARVDEALEELARKFGNLGKGDGR